MITQNNPNNEEAVRKMAGILLERLLTGGDAPFEATDLKQWKGKIRSYRRCILGTSAAFQELMDRISSPVPTKPEEPVHSDALT